MIIENKEYIKINIKEKLYYYLILDFKDLVNKDLNNNKDLDLFDKKINKLENKIFRNFINYLSKEYKINKIKDLNNFKEEFIYYEINKNNILLDLIEEVLY